MRTFFVAMALLAVLCLSGLAFVVVRARQATVPNPPRAPTHESSIQQYDENALTNPSEGAIAELVKLLKHDEKTRTRAATALAKVGLAAMPALTDAAKDNNPDVRIAALEALGDLGPAAMPTLIDAKKDTNWKIRLAVVEALRKVGPAAVPALVEGLADEEPIIVARSSSALGEMGPKAKEAIPTMLQILRGPDERKRICIALELIRIDPSTKKQVQAAMEQLVISENPSTRYEAAGILGEFGAAEVPALTKLIKDPDSDVRIQAANSLDEVGHDAKDAVPALIDVLRDERHEVRVRIAAAEVIRTIGPAAKAAVPGLIAALDNPEMAEAAEGAIQAIGPDAKAAVPALVKRLNDSRNHLPWGAIEALESIGPSAQDALPSLMKLLKHRDEMVRRKAIESIYKIGAPPKELVPALSPMLNDPSADVCITAASVLGKIGPSAKEAVPALLAGAGGIDSRLSWHGGVALLEIDPESAKKAIPAIVLALRIGNDEAIRETLRLLPTLGPEAKLIIPDMVELLSTVHDADARQTAITALARIGIAAENALPSVLRVLDDPDPIIRARAAECVGHIGATAKEATPKLQRLLTDDDESVRKAASEALKAIAPESEKR